MDAQEEKMELWNGNEVVETENMSHKRTDKHNFR